MQRLKIWIEQYNMHKRENEQAKDDILKIIIKEAKEGAFN